MSFEQHLMVIKVASNEYFMQEQTIICPNYLLVTISLERIAILKTCCQCSKIMFTVVIASSFFFKSICVLKRFWTITFTSMLKNATFLKIIRKHTLF